MIFGAAAPSHKSLFDPGSLPAIGWERTLTVLLSDEGSPAMAFAGSPFFPGPVGVWGTAVAPYEDLGDVSSLHLSLWSQVFFSKEILGEHQLSRRRGSMAPKSRCGDKSDTRRSCSGIF